MAKQRTFRTSYKSYDNRQLPRGRHREIAGFTGDGKLTRRSLESFGVPQSIAERLADGIFPHNDTLSLWTLPDTHVIVDDRVATGPEGWLNTCDQLRCNDTNAATLRYASQTIAKPAVVQRKPFVLAAKQNGFGAYVQFDNGNGANAASVHFAMEQGTPTLFAPQASGTGWSISDQEWLLLPSGFYICTGIFTTDASATLRRIVGLCNGNGKSTTGDTAKGCYIRFFDVADNDKVYDLYKPASEIPTIWGSTDLCIDCDDASGAGLLLAAQKAGLCKIAGFDVCSTEPYGSAAIEAMFDYENIAPPPIAHYQGTLSSLPSASAWTNLLRAFGKPATQAKTKTSYPDPVTLMHQEWVKLPDRSLTVLSLGMFTNLSAFLASPKNAASGMTGAELFDAKVLRVVFMAGREDGATEYNITHDDAGARHFLENCPAPMIGVSGEVGASVTFYPAGVGSNPTNNPWKTAADNNSPVADPTNGRAAWDILAAYIAVHGVDTNFGFKKPRGTIRVNRNGSSTTTTYKSLPRGNVTYVSLVTAGASSGPSAMRTVLESFLPSL